MDVGCWEQKKIPSGFRNFLCAVGYCEFAVYAWFDVRHSFSVIVFE